MRIKWLDNSKAYNFLSIFLSTPSLWKLVSSQKIEWRKEPKPIATHWNDIATFSFSNPRFQPPKRFLFSFLLSSCEDVFQWNYFLRLCSVVSRKLNEISVVFSFKAISLFVSRLRLSTAELRLRWNFACDCLKFWCAEKKLMSVYKENSSCINPTGVCDKIIKTVTMLQ